MKLFSSDPNGRPAITLPQVVALIPVLLNALAAYGIFTPSTAQASALRDLLLATVALIGGDALIRVGRNVADGIKARKPAAPTGMAIASPLALDIGPPVMRMHTDDMDKLVEAITTSLKPKPAAKRKATPPKSA
jgi:hypothetical protein